MSSDPARAIRTALRRLIPVLDGGFELREVRPLAGMTNRTYRIVLNGRAYVLRLPGHGVARLIDRGAERHNLDLAVRHGLAPSYLAFDAQSGELLMPALEGARPLTAARLRDDPRLRDRALALLKRLHRSRLAFRGRFDPRARLAQYVRLLEARAGALGAEERAAVAEVDRLAREVAVPSETLCPCHNDPVPENLLRCPDRLWLIDFEYAGWNDPLWDVADAAVECGCTAEEAELWLVRYSGCAPRPDELRRLYLWMAMADVLWAIWALLEATFAPQAASGLRAYARDRLARAGRLVASDRFRMHLGTWHQGARARPV